MQVSIFIVICILLILSVVFMGGIIYSYLKCKSVKHVCYIYPKILKQACKVKENEELFLKELKQEIDNSTNEKTKKCLEELYQKVSGNNLDDDGHTRDILANMVYYLNSVEAKENSTIEELTKLRNKVIFTEYCNEH